MSTHAADDAGTRPDRATSPYLAHLTSPQAAASAASGSVVLIPAGALEQHGAALPLGTDQIRADAVCAGIAERLGDRVVIGPPVPIGVSPHHLAFPGTLTLTTTTFAAVIREYAIGLHRQGWTRVLVVTGHGGNNATLTTVAQDLLATHPDLQLAWTPLTTVAADVVADLDVSEVHGHTGEAETAQLLHIAPDLIDTDRLAPGTTRTAELDPVSAVARAHKQPTLTLPYDRLTPSGVLGDPTRSTPEQGERIVTTIVERISGFITAWSQA